MSMFRGGLINVITAGTSSGGGAGVTSIEGLSGIVDLDSPDESINIQTAGQVIQLTTPNSGFAPSGASILLRQYDDNGEITKARVLSATSGIVLDDRGERSTSGLVVKLDFDNEPSVGQSLTWNGTKLLWATITGGGEIDTQTSINGLSGTLSLTSANSGALDIIQNGQTLILSGLFTPESGSIVDQKCADILLLSGITDGLPRVQTSIEGLSGVVDLDSPDGSIGISVNGQTIRISTTQTSFNGISGLAFISGINNEVTTSGQTILVSGHMNAASGALLDQKCTDIADLSGIIINFPLPVDARPASGAILPDSVSGQTIGTAAIPFGNVYAASGLFNDVLVSTNVSLLAIIGNEDFTTRPFILTSLAPTTFSRAATLADLTNGPAFVNTVEGLSGTIDLSSPDESIGITVNGQSIELTAIQKAARTFTQESGLEFVLQHGLNSEDFTWSMWRTDSTPDEILIPDNVYPSGSNHAVVSFTDSGVEEGYDGKIVFVG